MAQSQRNLLPAGFVLTITADAFSTGTVHRLADPGDSTTNYPVAAIAASSTATIGPFTAARYYEIISTQGEITFTILLDENTSADENETGVTSVDQFAGFAANLTTIPVGRTITTPANSQAIVYGTFTILGTFTIGGEIRFGAWPF